MGENLALVICKGIVEAHGGRIAAESGNPGDGARFTFTVPAAEQAPDGPTEYPARNPAQPGQTAGGQERILAVDDEPQMLLHLRNTLREAGYTPIVTGNPKEIEGLIESDNPHLVLLNPALAGPDRIGVMASIRQFTDAPVIFLSGPADDEDVALALETGADDYIVKPFSPVEADRQSQDGPAQAVGAGADAISRTLSPGRPGD